MSWSTLVRNATSRSPLCFYCLCFSEQLMLSVDLQEYTSCTKLCIMENYFGSKFSFRLGFINCFSVNNKSTDLIKLNYWLLFLLLSALLTNHCDRKPLRSGKMVCLYICQVILGISKWARWFIQWVTQRERLFAFSLYKQSSLCLWKHTSETQLTTTQ